MADIHTDNIQIAVSLEGTHGKPYPTSVELVVGRASKHPHMVNLSMLSESPFYFTDGGVASAMSILVSPNVAKKFGQELIRFADRMINEANAGEVKTYSNGAL